jgi:hypothetical protein
MYDIMMKKIENRVVKNTVRRNALGVAERIATSNMTTKLQHSQNERANDCSLDGHTAERDHRTR